MISCNVATHPNSAPNIVSEIRRPFAWLLDRNRRMAMMVENSPDLVAAMEQITEATERYCKFHQIKAPVIDSTLTHREGTSDLTLHLEIT